MGYSANSPVKKIWIPLEYGWLQEKANQRTLLQFNEDYKKRYGIDLTEIVKLDGNTIVIAGDVSTYVIPTSGYSVAIVDNYPWRVTNFYDAGNSDALTKLYAEERDGNYGFGLEFKISKSADSKYENITVEFSEH